MFAPDPAPSWILAFEHDPAAALDALLRDEFYRGAENLLGPAEALPVWAGTLKSDPTFTSALDAALATHILDAPSGDLPGARAAWRNACSVIASIDGCVSSLSALRARFVEFSSLIEQFAVDPTNGLVDSTLMALSAWQTDDSLEPLWRRLASLRGDTPVLRGIRGLLGLDSMPVGDGRPVGFREDVADALIAYSDAVAFRAGNALIAPERAKDAVIAATNLVLARQPHPHRWAHTLAQHQIGDQQVSWLRAAGLEWTPADHAPEQSSVGWGDVAERGYELRLESQEAAGGGDFPRALALVRHAVEIDPWSPYSWSVFVKVALRAGETSEALDAAWSGHERFPQNPVIWHLSGASMEAQGRFALAEEVYTELLEFFPANEQALNSLASLLVRENRLTPAIQLLESYCKQHPGRDKPEVTLANAYGGVGRYSDAEAILRPLVERGLDNPHAWTVLEGVLLKAGKPKEAEQVRASGRTRFPKDPQFLHTAPHHRQEEKGLTINPTTRLSVGEIVTYRRKIRRFRDAGVDVTEDRTALEEAIADSNVPPSVKAFERTMLTIDSADSMERTRGLLEDARNRSYETVPLLYASACTRRRDAQRQKFSNALFRDALEPLRVIQARTPRGRVLAALGALRLVFEASDEVALTERGEEVVERLRGELDRAADGKKDEFRPWWSGEVKSRTVNGARMDMETVAARLEANTSIVDRLEEDYVRKLTRDLVPS